MKEIEITDSNNKKVTINVYNCVISYVSRRTFESGKAIFYDIHFNRKSELQFVSVPASLLSEIMSESGYKSSVRVFNRTNEDFNQFFSGAKVEIYGVPYVKEQTKFLNPFTGVYTESKPAKNDGISYHISKLEPTEDNLRYDKEQNEDIKQGLSKEREAIRQATANYLASLL